MNSNIWWSKNGFRVAVGDALSVLIENTVKSTMASYLSFSLSLLRLTNSNSSLPLEPSSLPLSLSLSPDPKPRSSFKATASSSPPLQVVVLFCFLSSQFVSASLLLLNCVRSSDLSLQSTPSIYIFYAKFSIIEWV